MTSHIKQITVFSLDECFLGIDSTCIQTIQAPGAFTKMPQKEEQLLLGMIQLSDGRFMHVINTTKLLGLSSSVTVEGKAIVFNNASPLVGLIVNSPIRVIEIDEKKIAPALPISKVTGDYLTGTVTDAEGNIVLLLNMGKLLATVTSTQST